MGFGWYVSLAVAADEIRETITVRERSLSEAERHAPTAFVTHVDPAQYTEEMESVADAVGDTVGVSVRRYGGLGAFSTLSIRGSSANQVSVYLDGVPLSRAHNEVVNLADLPLDSLERIEVYRGTTPLSLGAAGIGGIVNLIPKAPSQTPYTHATAGYGSFTTRKFALTHMQLAGGFQTFANVTMMGSAGNFRFRSDNDTPLNPFDDREVTRVHNSFDSVAALFRARRTWGNASHLDLLQETFWKTAELPGRGANPSLHATSERLRLLQAVRWRTGGWPGNNTDTMVQGFVTFERSFFRDPFGELGAGQQQRRDDTLVGGGNASVTSYLTSTQVLSWFVETSGEAFLPENSAVNAPVEPEASRWRATAGVQHQWSLWHDRLRAVPTLRFEWLRDRSSSAFRDFGRQLPRIARDEGLWNPMLGLEWNVTEGFSVRGNLARVERAPNFTELFGNTGSVIGNPALVPERAWNRDLGVRFERMFPDLDLRLAGEYAYFNNDVDRLIVFVQRSAAIFKPENIGRARLRGHEAGMRWEWRQRWLLDTNLTWQEPENRSPAAGGIYLGKRLPGRPRTEWYLRASSRYGRITPYYELNYVSGNFLDQANFDRVPSRTIHTVGLTAQVAWGFAVGLQARNLTDNQVSDVGGFPLPGRALFATVTWKPEVQQ